MLGTVGRRGKKLNTGIKVKRGTGGRRETGGTGGRVNRGNKGNRGTRIAEGTRRKSVYNNHAKILLLFLILHRKNYLNAAVHSTRK